MNASLCIVALSQARTFTYRIEWCALRTRPLRGEWNGHSVCLLREGTEWNGSSSDNSEGWNVYTHSLPEFSIPQTLMGGDRVCPQTRTKRTLD